MNAQVPVTSCLLITGCLIEDLWYEDTPHLHVRTPLMVEEAQVGKWVVSHEAWLVNIIYEAYHHDSCLQLTLTGNYSRVSLADERQSILYINRTG